jgi:D-3-phosphoglycerate dehydrogenase
MSTSRPPRRKGIIVMNTPFGNSITTAEHAIAMMFALARELPAADASTQAGKWEKNRFMGVEITGKTLGVDRLRQHRLDRRRARLGPEDEGRRLRPVPSDGARPRISASRRWSSTSFSPAPISSRCTRRMTDKTRGILDAKAIAKMKKGVRIINCARGGLIVEQDLLEGGAEDSGKVAGAALDVFEVEPAKESPFFGRDERRLHAASRRFDQRGAGERRAAGRRADVGLPDEGRGLERHQHAVDHGRGSAEAEAVRPKLAEVLGAFAGQVTEEPIKEVEILFDGVTASMNTRALISAALAGLIRPQVSDVNMVSAPIMVKERGIVLSEVKRDKSGVFDGYIKLTVTTEKQTRSIAGTVFSDGKPRFIQIKGINLDAEVGQHMLYTTNPDAPGIIGLLGTICGQNGVNIANFQLGRNKPGGDAIALLYLDAPFPEKVLAELRANPKIASAKPLKFDVAAA